MNRRIGEPLPGDYIGLNDIGAIKRFRLKAHLLRHTWRERMWRWLARRVPRSLAYWCTIRVAARTLPTDQHPDDQTVTQMFRRWEECQ